MTSTQPPVAGWYPDPSGAPRQERWWNGIAWADAVRPAPGAAAAPGFVPAPAPAPGFVPEPSPAPAPYTIAQGAVPVPVAAGVEPSTAFIWWIVALPLLGLLIDLATSIADLMDPGFTASVLNEDSGYSSLDLGWTAASFLVIGLARIGVVLCAYGDVRVLRERGVPSPFSAGWAFFSLIGVPVYAIGRSIVARRRTGRGIAPLVVTFAGIGVQIVANIVIGVLASLALFSDPGWVSSV